MADETRGRQAGARRRRPGGPHGRRRKPRARRTGWRIVLWTAAALVVLGGSGIGYVYFKLNGNLHGVDINSALGTDRPDNVDNGSQDILVLGSDSRAGDNNKYGRDEGSSRSDTAMIVHVYAGHKQASVVSIPRDTMVPRPECKTLDGKTSPAVRRAQFNDAYSVGGAVCAVKTVEAMTGIRMDHYLEVDFAGFQKLIDKLGGVEVTTTKPIRDKWSHLDLPAGKHTLNGEQSLGLVRTRHGVGDGSDLGRIKLQQAFIKALIDQVKSVGLFTSPTKLYGIADTATKALTTDSDLASVQKLLSFANGLKGIGSGDMHMVTLPVTTDPLDKNRVVPLKAAKEMWQALHEDKQIPASALKDGEGTKTDADGVVK
ncbi:MULTISPECIES: LCP family protein [Streptomyces]|uniref:LCP family protein n=1 Tax=Streptomyces TaxID=1883 RepID=UPI00163BC91C|nr:MULTISPECIES: LCP family protein [Streptomyces]MBC2873487.1 LCP family protein [Streptomyces sp. TYQ1024]UBI36795.1 LCP family protein [Streptomyces mobaraensis]UKW29387.1 LCP family protein [Streptomyces sp. TYQ1024]